MTNVENAILLKRELDELRPLSKADEMRIMQKFRLDWNYHSNHLEGNTLTYGETKALILFGITAQGKTLQEHFEVTGHDEAIKWVLEVIKEDRPLTENFIRELHRLILKQPYEKEAITPDGQPTTKRISIGVYKSTPNHVRTRTGEMFYFATPEETPAKMHDLLQWYRTEAKRENIEPILLAAQFHYRFIRIHPFDDGNGRTARILMNFILMKFGYPPVIIKTEDKQNYFAALRQADAGIIEPFIEYIAENLVRSLEIMISGAKGESVEEEDDLEKELALLKQKLTYQSNEVKLAVEKTKEGIITIFNDVIIPFFNAYVERMKIFEEFYERADYMMVINDVDFFEENVIENVRKNMSKRINKLQILASFYSPKSNSNSKVGFNSNIFFQFSSNNYSISVYDPHKPTFVKRYSEILSKEEQTILIEKETKRYRDEIVKTVQRRYKLINPK